MREGDILLEKGRGEGSILRMDLSSGRRKSWREVGPDLRKTSRGATTVLGSVPGKSLKLIPAVVRKETGHPKYNYCGMRRGAVCRGAIREKKNYSKGVRRCGTRLERYWGNPDNGKSLKMRHIKGGGRRIEASSGTASGGGFSISNRVRRRAPLERGGEESSPYWFSYLRKKGLRGKPFESDKISLGRTFRNNRSPYRGAS